MILNPHTYCANAFWEEISLLKFCYLITFINILKNVLLIHSAQNGQNPAQMSLLISAIAPIDAVQLMDPS